MWTAMLAVAYATSRASHARQVKGDDPDKKGYPGPPGWGLGAGLTTLPCKNQNVPKNSVIGLTRTRDADGWRDNAYKNIRMEANG